MHLPEDAAADQPKVLTFTPYGKYENPQVVAAEFAQAVFAEGQTESTPATAFNQSEYAQAMAESKRVLRSQNITSRPCVYQVLSSYEFDEGEWELPKTAPEEEPEDDCAQPPS